MSTARSEAKGPTSIIEISDAKPQVRGTVSIEKLKKLYNERNVEAKRNLYLQIMEECVLDLQDKNGQLQEKLEKSEERTFQYMMTEIHRLQKELEESEQRSSDKDEIIKKYTNVLDSFSKELIEETELLNLERMLMKVKPLLDETQKLFQTVEKKISAIIGPPPAEPEPLPPAVNEIEKADDISDSQSVSTDKNEAYDKHSPISESEMTSNERNDEGPIVQFFRDLDRKVSQLSSK